jgi:hypothetical protein
LVYHDDIVKTLRSLACTSLLLCALSGTAQVRRQVPAPEPESTDFGSKFFDDLRSLFGRLQRGDLDRAFQRAQAVHCPDLVEEKGEWKQVAFLNDDRSLGDWHFDNIDEVKRDLVKFVFTGRCPNQQSPVRVATSYPVKETFERFQKGQIPISKVVISDNDAVSVIFDRPSEAYTFELPYLYIERRNSAGNIYTLTPPTTTSQPDPTVVEEFRCKALSDAELTYRFLLCRTRVAPRDPRLERQNERQALGNAAYYIFSDGREASSSVKLSFGDAPVDAADSHTPATPAPSPQSARVPNPARAPEREPAIPPAAAQRSWQPAASQTRLVSVGQGEFRLRFKPESWTGRIGKPQLLSAQMLSDFVETSPPARNREYCVWRPGMPDLAAHLLEKSAADDVVYSTEFRKTLQSVSAVMFEMQNDTGLALGTLECFFPQNQTPADVTVARWVSIVGTHLELDTPGQ